MRGGSTVSKLHPQQRFLAILIVVGGAAVLGSYALVFAYPQEIRAGLWGSVPEVIRPLYVVCMLLAAAGYFPFTYLLVLRTRPVDLAAAVRLPYRALQWVYGLILVPSALWVPLTVQMLQAPAAPLWWAIRAVLALVALGSTALLAILIAIAVRRGGRLAWVSAAGGAAFWLQTAVLDALVWPEYFPL